MVLAASASAFASPGEPGQRHRRFQPSSAVASGRSPQRTGLASPVVEARRGDRNIAPFDYNSLRRAFSGGAYMANNGYTRELAERNLAADRADLRRVRPAFIPIPDLVERLRLGRRIG